MLLFHLLCRQKLKNVRDLDENCDITNCANKKSSDNIQSELVNKLGYDYDLYSPKVKNPYLSD